MDDEDSPQKINDRIDLVRNFMDKESMRMHCYASAMGRKWGVPAYTFFDMSHGPKKWPTKSSKYQYRSAKENGGVKTLIELSLDALEHAYVLAGEACQPHHFWNDLPGLIPTAYEHNNCLCIVPRSKSKRQRE